MVTPLALRGLGELDHARHRLGLLLAHPGVPGGFVVVAAVADQARLVGRVVQHGLVDVHDDRRRQAGGRRCRASLGTSASQSGFLSAGPARSAARAVHGLRRPRGTRPSVCTHSTALRLSLAADGGRLGRLRLRVRGEACPAGGACRRRHGRQPGRQRGERVSGQARVDRTHGGTHRCDVVRRGYHADR